MAWIAVNKDDNIYVFKHKPQRISEPIMVETSEYEEDHYGKIHYKEKESGEYKTYWADTGYYSNKDYIHFDKGSIINRNNLASHLQDLTFDDEPVNIEFFKI